MAYGLDQRAAALQTATILSDIINGTLQQHPVITANKIWRRLASTALTAIDELRDAIDEDFTRSHDLHQLIIEKCLIKGKFLLASGSTSSVYFDLKSIMLSPFGANLIADAVLEELKDLDVEAIGGLAMGAIPIASVVCAKSYDGDRIVEAFFVRKESKDHGTERLIDGIDVKGLNVVLVEDVSTTGSALLIAARVVREHGGTVEHAITVVDRLEGAMENLSHHGIALHAIFTRDDFE